MSAIEPRQAGAGTGQIPRRSLAGMATATLLAATSLALSPAARSAPALSAEADAELIALCGLLQADQARINAWDAGAINLSEEDASDLNDTLRRTGRALTAMRPVTQAGLIAKAQAIQAVFAAEVCAFIGSTVESSGEFHEVLAWSLINDVLATVRA